METFPLFAVNPPHSFATRCNPYPMSTVLSIKSSNNRRQVRRGVVPTPRQCHLRHNPGRAGSPPSPRRSWDSGSPVIRPIRLPGRSRPPGGRPRPTRCRRRTPQSHLGSVRTSDQTAQPCAAHLPGSAAGCCWFQALGFSGPPRRVSAALAFSLARQMAFRTSALRGRNLPQIPSWTPLSGQNKGLGPGIRCILYLCAVRSSLS